MIFKRIAYTYILSFMALMVLGAGAVFGQDYPSKVIRIVTSAAGGGNDYLARLTAQQLTRSLGQQVIVENRGIVAAEIVAKAEPDGYTLIVYGGPLWIQPLLRPYVTYDPVKDFSPITLIAGTPGVIVVHPSLPVRSVRDLIALARARPNELNYSAGAVGASPHLAGELFKSMTGVKILHVPYKGAGPGVNAVISGETQLMFPTANAVLPALRTGRLRAIAVSSSKRSALVPDLPTVSESGVPGYESIAVIGLQAPAKTSSLIVNRLNIEVVKVLGQSSVKEQLLNSGNEPIGSSPAEFSERVKSDISKWGKLIADLGLREK